MNQTASMDFVADTFARQCLRSKTIWKASRKIAILFMAMLCSMLVRMHLVELAQNRIEKI